MISASKYTFSLKSPKIWRPKVTKILQISLKNVCEFPPRRRTGSNEFHLFFPFLNFVFWNICSDDQKEFSKIGGGGSSDENNQRTKNLIKNCKNLFDNFLFELLFRLETVRLTLRTYNPSFGFESQHRQKLDDQMDH